MKADLILKNYEIAKERYAALGEAIDAKGFKPLRALFWGFFILCHCFFLFIYMAKIGGFLLLGGTRF